MLNRRGPLAKLVGGAIGLTKEYQADRDARKEVQAPGSQIDERTTPHAVPASISGFSNANSTVEYDAQDDEEWVRNLDAAAQDHESRDQRAPQRQEITEDAQIDEKLLSNFVSRHPMTQTKPLEPLPMPVILPQRRPETRQRGFVRAYAPVLDACDISQEAWLEFLDGFERSIKNNPWFHVANGAAWVAGNVQSAVAGASVLAAVVSTVIQVGIETSRKTYINYQHNKYLDEMNEHFFKPRGLYCLVITYKPSSEDVVEEVDIEHNITKMVEAREGQNKWKRLVSSSSSTTTKHGTEIPEAAPLVFPQLDSLDAHQKEGSVKRFGQFLQDYYDRQSAAKFEAKNSSTNIPQAPHKEFASKYSDPNHPAGSGGLVSIASGGRYNPVGPLGRLQERVTDRRAERGVDRPAGKEARKGRRDNKPLRRLLKENALYLMVVNLPTQEDMDRVTAAMNRIHDA